MSGRGLVTTSVRPATTRARDTWAATGRRLPIVALSWLVRREYLITVRAVDESASVPQLPQARWVLIKDPTELLLGPGDLRPARAEARRRLDEGQECWAAWIGGELAHWRWEATRPAFLPYLGRTLRPEAGDLCVVDVYTVPCYRGRGLHTVGTLLALERARARGLTRLVGLVAWWNAPARHVMEGKTGRTVVGSVGYWTVGVGRGTSHGEESGSRARRLSSPPCAPWACLAPVPRSRPDREQPGGRRLP